MKQKDIIFLFYVVLVASFWKIEIMFIYELFCKGVKNPIFGMILMFLCMFGTLKILTDFLLKITRKIY